MASFRNVTGMHTARADCIHALAVCGTYRTLVADVSTAPAVRPADRVK